MKRFVIEKLRSFELKKFITSMIQYVIILALCIVVGSFAELILSGFGLNREYVSYAFDVLIFVLYLGVIGKSIHADLLMALLSVAQFIDTCSYLWGRFIYNRGALLWALCFCFVVVNYWYQEIKKEKENVE